MKYVYWFKANRNGLGWRPANWKGWLMIVIYLVSLVYAFMQSESGSHTVRDTFVAFLPKFLVLTALLIILTYLKGESIVWGEKENDKHIP